MFLLRSQTADLRQPWSRRDALRLAVGSTGLGFAGGLSSRSSLNSARAADATDPTIGRAQSCIFIYLYGGPSQLDVWDLKPDAPAEIRGEFKPIATTVPGLELCEHLPLLAKRAEHLAVVRSLTHNQAQHGNGGLQMLTGHSANKWGEIPPDPKHPPHFGSLVGKQLGPRRDVPPFVSLPWQITTQINLIPGQGAGLLGSAFDPVRVQYDDQAGKNFLCPDPGKLATALNLDRETDATRDRYGRNVFGQSLLLARRLVESGVRTVTVYWPDRKDEVALNYNGKRQPVSVPMWDTHGTKIGDTAIFPSLKNRLLPPLDAASSALLDDLQATGRLDETLVVWTGEFGRTPKMTGDGRGHYSQCFSSMLAGGGVRGGIVHGASDKTASTPARDPVSPGDLFATMYHLLGLPAETSLAGPDGTTRPAATGKVVRGLLA